MVSIETAAQALSSELRAGRCPGLVSVGIAYESPTAIVVYVERSKLGCVPAAIPVEQDGFPVRVVKIGRLRTAS